MVIVSVSLIPLFIYLFIFLNRIKDKEVFLLQQGKSRRVQSTVCERKSDKKSLILYVSVLWFAV